MKIDRHIHCKKCHYDLFGLEINVCPECGQEFDSQQNLAGRSNHDKNEVRLSRIFLGTFMIFTSYILGAVLNELFPWLGGFPTLPESVPVVVFMVGVIVYLLRLLNTPEMIYGIIPIEMIMVWLTIKFGPELLSLYNLRELCRFNLYIVIPWLAVIAVVNTGRYVFLPK